MTPELWTAASAADATTGERESFRASSSTHLKRSAAEISRAAEAGEATSEGSAGRPAARSRGSGGSPTTEGVRSAVFSIGSLASARRYSTTAAPSWRRSPLRRIVSFRIRRPATNVPFEEFRSLRTAVPFPNVTSAWLLETDSWSTRTVEERLRPSVTSPSESSISRPSTTRT